MTAAAVTVLLVYAFAPPPRAMAAGAPEVLWRTNGYDHALAYFVGSLSFSCDGSRLASAGYTPDRGAYIWRTSDGTLFTSIGPGDIYEDEEVFSLAFSPRTNMMVTVSSFEGRETSTTRVKLLSWSAGWPRWDQFYTGGNGHDFDHARFSPDGLQIALPYTAAGAISSIEVDSLPGERLGRFSLEAILDEVIFLPSYGWSRDQRYFASVGKYLFCDPDDVGEPPTALNIACGWHAVLWDAQSFSFLRQLQGHAGTTSCVAFSPSEDVLATGGGDGTIRLWNIPEGTTNREFQAYTTGISFLCYAHDGRLLVCSDGHSVKFWRVADGKLLCTYNEDNEGLPEISSLAVSPDNRHFAVGGLDTSVTVARMPLWISDVSLAGQDVVIRWYGGSGLYQLQACTDLLNGSWQNIGVPTTSMSATNVNAPRVFFRVQSLPNP